jgi:hypothetical protein
LGLAQLRQGRIESVKWELPKLQKVKKDYGQAVAELLVEKRKEIEEHNASGELVDMRSAHAVASKPPQAP